MLAANARSVPGSSSTGTSGISLGSASIASVGKSTMNNYNMTIAAGMGKDSVVINDAGERVYEDGVDVDGINSQKYFGSYADIVEEVARSQSIASVSSSVKEKFVVNLGKEMTRSLQKSKSVQFKDTPEMNFMSAPTSQQSSMSNQGNKGM